MMPLEANIAQKMPEFLAIVLSVEFNARKLPCCGIVDFQKNSNLKFLRPKKIRMKKNYMVKHMAINKSRVTIHLIKTKHYFEVRTKLF